MVGAYGNAWIHTPHFDELAAESTVFDFAFIDTPDVVSWYDMVWAASRQPAGGERSGNPHYSPENTVPPRCLIDRVRSHGLKAVLITDAVEIAEHSAAAGFDEVIHIAVPRDERGPQIIALGEQEPSGNYRPSNSLDGEKSHLPNTLGSIGDGSAGEIPNELAATIEDTRLAQFFAAATDWLLKADEPFFLWLHTRGLYRPWDAPYSMRARHTEEGDPTPSHSAAVPNRHLNDDCDPDEVLGVLQSYAAQVEALDLLVGSLMDTLKSTERLSNTFLALVSARGYSLGEHRRLGLCDAALYNELIQSVMMLRAAGTDNCMGAAVRSSTLVNTSQLVATIDDWLLAQRDSLPTPPRSMDASADQHLPGSLFRELSSATPAQQDMLLVRGVGDELACRTRAWHLRLPRGLSGDATAELYAKPSDRWEVNEISTRASDIVAKLVDATRLALSQRPDNSPLALAEELTHEAE